MPHQEVAERATLIRGNHAIDRDHMIEQRRCGEPLVGFVERPLGRRRRFQFGEERFDRIKHAGPLRTLPGNMRSPVQDGNHTGHAPFQ